MGHPLGRGPSSRVRVRPAVPGDSTELGRIDYDTWTSRRDRPVLEAADVPFFERSHGTGELEFLVAILPEAIAGFAVVEHDVLRPTEAGAGRRTARVRTIAVDPLWRRRRAATALLLTATLHAGERGADRLAAVIPRDHEPMTRLLAAAGFRRDRRTEHDPTAVADETRWARTTTDTRDGGTVPSPDHD